MTDGLFEEPSHLPHGLSEMYQTAEYWTRKGKSARYFRYSAFAWCDECAALQHEHYRAGVSLDRVRARATTKRTVVGGKDLLLCGAHTSLWREMET